MCKILVDMGYYAATELHLPTDQAPHELGYLAGIIDSDGCFTASKKSHTFGIKVEMTDHSVIYWLKDRFAGSISRGRNLPSGKRTLSWVLSRQADLHHLLPFIEPILICKRAQAKAMLTLIQHRVDKPIWETPSSKASHRERERRRLRRATWKTAEGKLMDQISAVRHSPIR